MNITLAKNTDIKTTKKASAKDIAAKALVILLALIFIGSTVVAVLPSLY